MRDKVLQRRIGNLQELIELWGNFREMIDAVKKGASFDDENNREFLNVKSSIARKFQAVADGFEKRTFPEDEITDVLSQVVSLEQVKKMSSFTGDQFENTWHRVYIAMNKILGHLENERDALMRVSWLGFGMGKMLKSKLFIFLVIIGFISGAVFMGYRFYTQKVRPAFEVSEEGEKTEAQTELVKLLREARKFITGLRRQVKEGKVEGEIEGEPTRVTRTFREYGGNWYSIVTALVGAILCGWMASNKGKSPILWGAFGFFCCPIAFIIILLKS